ncbi:MAG: transporter substrate-binding domain-containing protein [Crocinitomicaceae bacterium]
MKLFLLVFTLFFVGGLNAQVPAEFKMNDTLKVGYNISPPFVIEKQGELSGPAIWLWSEVSRQLDLKFEYIEMPLDSLLYNLTHQTIDLSASPLSITSERSQFIDFSAPYYIAHSSILKKNKSKDERTWSFITSFFSLDFFRVLGALCVVILIFGFLEWIFERKANAEEFGSGLKGVWNGFWWSAVTMTTVGYGDKSPKTLGGRIVALIWMFTAIIIISGFTASIASSLTTEKMSTMDEEIEDFKQKTIGTIQHSGTEKWLKDNFYTQRMAFSSVEEALSALDNEEIEAIAYDRPILKDIIRRDSLSAYTLLDDEFNAQFYAMGMSRSLPAHLKNQINVAILEETETMDWKVLLTEYDLEKEQ